MKVRFLPRPDDNDIIEKYNITRGGVYEVLGYGAKVFIRVGNKIIDVFPSRLEIVEDDK
jgi:hypothetical protein